MNRTIFFFCIFLIVTGIKGAGSESYSDLMDRAEKLTAARYNAKSRAFKIKSRELDEILDSKETTEEKIIRLKNFIREMEKSSQESGTKKRSEEAADPVKMLKEAADRNDPESLYRLGMIYWEGRLTTRSLTRALHFFTQAAAKKHQKSEYMLALANLQGKSVIPDPAKAFAQFSVLRRNGFLAAGIPMGIQCYEGNGTVKDYAAAEKYLQESLPHKNEIPAGFAPEAVLGQIYYSGGFGVKKDPVKAAKFLKEAGNDPESLYLLGRLYLEGNGIAGNPGRAAEYFRQAAENGHIMAGYELGCLFRLGHGVKKDDFQAVQYLTPAADRIPPNIDAVLILAEIYADPKSPARNDRNAFHYYQTAARLGNAEAYYRCGLRLLEGIGVEKNPSDAFEYLKIAAGMNHVPSLYLCGELEHQAKHADKSQEFYRKAADRGHAEAIRKFAMAALNGDGMKADPALAIEYLKKIGADSSAADLELLASLYESGIGALRPQLKEAIRYYTLAANMQSVKSQLRLAQIYSALGKKEPALRYAEMAAKAKNPDGIKLLAQLRTNDTESPEKKPESMKYLRQLADQGDHEAMRQLGMQLYARNDFTGAAKYLDPLEDERQPELLFVLGDIAFRQENYGRAFQFLAKAADAGSVKALLLLGRMYQQGNGVRQDFRRAFVCYRRAADKKDPEGMFMTGCMYYNAEGISPDYAEAFRWFLAAAEKGHILSMQNLSIMYKEGIGVPKNNVEAAKWRRKSMAK